MVVEAVRQLREKKKVRIPVVMTGLPIDLRDAANTPMSRLLQAIASAGLADQVIVLGQVPYNQLVALMRAAAVIIQPFCFEGWSTIAQDAKALGRPLMCSDIPVLREQAPNALAFFPPDRPEVLAEVLSSRWFSLDPGPDPAREENALAKEREFAKAHGEALFKICAEACSV